MVESEPIRVILSPKPDTLDHFDKGNPEWETARELANRLTRGVKRVMARHSENHRPSLPIQRFDRRPIGPLHPKIEVVLNAPVGPAGIREAEPQQSLCPDLDFAFYDVVCRLRCSLGAQGGTARLGGKAASGGAKLIEVKDQRRCR
jgi:hypothetical protein